MSINGMNGQFGMNIRKYQQQQGVRFGSALTGGSKLSSGFELNDSIFKPNDKNLFMRSKQMRMENRGGYNADAIRMLNEKAAQEKAQAKAQGNQSAQKQPSLKEIGKEMKSAFKAFDEAFGKGGKKADAPKSAGNAKASEAVNDIKNANDKETLQGAVDGAKTEQSGVQAQQQQVNSQAKATAQNETNALQTAQQTEQRLNQATQTLNQNEQKLGEAKTEVQTCESNYSAAQTKTSDCRQALANAKAAATEDNPNTAAIAQAEANLKTAEAEEQQAKQQLEAAKQKETQAQQAVDQSKQDVQSATGENNKAQAAANQAKTENQQAQAQLSEVKQQSADLKTGIAEGEQKLEQMETTEAPENTGGTPADPNTPSDPFAKQQYETNNQLIENGGYSAEQKEAMYQARENIQNMKPGDTFKCGADEYAMDATGNLTINGQPYEADGYENPQEMFAENAVGSVRHKADSDNKFAREEALMGGKSKAENTVDAKPKPKAQNESKKASTATTTSAKPENTVNTMNSEKTSDSKPADKTKPEDNTAKARGFSSNSVSTVYANEDDAGKDFEVKDGKYFVDGNEVSENEFVEQFDEAKANSTEGEPDIHDTFTKDDIDKLAKRKKPDGSSKAS